MRFVLVLGLLVGSLGLIGCDGDDCLSMCEEAQERDCTSIDNCDTFCSRTQTLAEKAGCEDERDALEDCAADGDACSVDARCDSQESAFASCSAPYCIANPSATECMIE